MDNEIESLRLKLGQERRAIRIAEAGFILGAMGFGWGIWWFNSAHHHDSSILAFTVGAAVVGVVVEQLLVAAYRFVMLRRWKRDEGRRFGRILHGRETGKS